MNIKQAKKEAVNAIKSYFLKNEDDNYVIPINRQRPVVFMGPAGIGKTDIAKQVAEDLDIGFLSYTITHHTRQSAVGLPKIITKTYDGQVNTVTEYSMSEIISSIYEYIEKNNKDKGILFIDEFNCVSETLTPTMLQFLQNKTFGMNKVPDGWKIILAGNPGEYNKSAKELDIVTMDRLRIIPITPDFGSWKEYAVLRNIHPSILSYISQKQSNFCVFTNDKNGRQIVTPRGWEELSYTIYTYNKLELDIDHSLISQFINHQKISLEFAHYYDLFNNIISNEEIDKILNGKVSKSLSERLKNTSFDIHCSIIWILTNRLQTSSSEYIRLTSICDEIHPLLLEAKEIQDLKPLIVADISENSKAYIDKLLKSMGKESFELNFEYIKDNFKVLTSNRTEKRDLTNLFVTNILQFIEDIFGCNGEMEMFLNNISMDPNIIKMLIESNNKKYLECSEQFVEVYNGKKIRTQIKKIS